MDSEHNIEHRRHHAKRILIVVLVLVALLLGYIIYCKAYKTPCIKINIDTAPIHSDLSPPYGGIEEFMNM